MLTKRERFLLRMFGEYWDNITRAEDNAWKIFASYTALFAGLSLASNIIGSFGFVILLLSFTFAAVTIALRANLWYVRNLGLISNIEKEFLEIGDYGKIVPHWFQKKPNYVNNEIWWIQIVAYIAVAFFVTAFVFPSLKELERFLTITDLFVCFALSLVYGMYLRCEYEKFKTEAPGKAITTKAPKTQ